MSKVTQKSHGLTQFHTDRCYAGSMATDTPETQPSHTETCPQCGSPGPDGECSWDCTYYECPGCDFKGDGDEHIALGMVTTGFAGGTIILIQFVCGYVLHDDSDDVAAAR